MCYSLTNCACINTKLYYMLNLHELLNQKNPLSTLNRNQQTRKKYHQTMQVDSQFSNFLIMTLLSHISF